MTDYREDLIGQLVYRLRQELGDVALLPPALVAQVCDRLVGLVERSAWMGAQRHEITAEADRRVDRYRATNGALMNDVDRQKNLAGKAQTELAEACAELATANRQLDAWRNAFPQQACVRLNDGTWAIKGTGLVDELGTEHAVRPVKFLGDHESNPEAYPVTKAGTVLTPELVDELADEAEAGYDVSSRLEGLRQRDGWVR